MAMKAGTDRSDPKKNKSLAIRMVLKTMPSSKATEVMAAVKKQYGHDISQNMVYMVKAKRNMGAGGKAKRGRKANGQVRLSSAALWVDAIKLARQLLRATGSVENATALLRAIEG